MTKDEIQKEALEILLPLYNGGVEISMGVGKTLLGLMHMKERSKQIIGARFLVVAPKLSIFESWKADAFKYGIENLLEEIDFCTYRSLSKQSHCYDVIYLDECHSLKYSHSKYLTKAGHLNINVVGLTGTYPKFNSGEKGEMCNRYCPKVYEYKTDTAVEDNILNDYRIYIHMIDLDKANNIPVEMGGKSWMTSEIKNYNYWTDRINKAGAPKQLQILRVMRMKSMMGYKSKEEKVFELLSRRKTKTLLFANTQDQADRLAEHSYHSSNKNSEENLRKFKNDEIDLLSAVEQLSEGVNIPNLKSGIIMHAYANNRRTSQKLGRLLRLNPDDTAGIHILCYRNTIDEDWVTAAVSHLNQDKIIWLS